MQSSLPSIFTLLGQCLPARRLFVGWLVVAGGIGGAARSAAEVGPMVDPEGLYLQSIKPLFQEKCVSCHGALRAEAGLRLDAIQAIRQGGSEGRITDTEDIRQSRLLQRITTLDEDARMPPEGEGTRLSQQQVGLVEEWLRRQMPGPTEEVFVASPREHWAYQPIVFPELPKVRSVDDANPIDVLISAERQALGLVPSPPAEEASWLRRLCYDLTGMPPTVEELDEFTADSGEDRHQRWIERMLAKPSYGERWGRHWMDVWRYSDWEGYKEELRGSQRHIWHWRDWIVESLNCNKPYDEMIVEMLAADEVAPRDASRLRATGFLARNFHKSNRNIWLDATVEHTAKAFLGMTLNCSKCHDHKYDPLPQAGYYQFRAIFEPHRVRSQVVRDGPLAGLPELPRAYDAEPETPTYVFVRGNDEMPDKEQAMTPQVPDWIPAPFRVEAIAYPIDLYYPELMPAHRDRILGEKVAAEAQARLKLDQILPQRSVAESSMDPTAASQPLAAAGPKPWELAFSEWKVAVADREAWVARYRAEEIKYGLRARGEGEAEASASQATSARLAAEAEHCFHRARAEYESLRAEQAVVEARNASATDPAKRQAAVEAAEKKRQEASERLRELPWELAAETKDYTPVGTVFPAASTGRRLALAKWIVDPRNPLTARVAVNHLWMRHFGTPLVENTFDFGLSSPRPKLWKVLDWLSAEWIRSGWDMKHLHRLILSSKVYGLASDEPRPAVWGENQRLDPDNHYFWRANLRRLDAEEVRDSLLTVAGELDRTFAGPDIDFQAGETIHRRSLYFRHAYEKQMLMMVMFDAASPSECYRRKPSVIPQQALALSNSPLTRELAGRLAMYQDGDPVELAGGEGRSSAAWVTALFRRVLGRLPTAEEQAACCRFLASQARLLADPDQLTPFDDAPAPRQLAPEQAARRSLALVLLNHHEFISVR
jgi:mono/diheme cytochrome c family protein